MDLHFKTNIQLKSIIGKDLINDDNIAILELVKNSFDADAKRVDISFVNLKENDDAETETYTDKTSRLIIADDGQGMDMDDIQNKWLNIAYSEKKSNLRQNNRMMAGAKGVGRFSCDRLGEYLNLYAKKQDSKAYILLKIDWKKFEIEDDKKEIQSIVLDYEELSFDEFKSRNIPFFDHGVLLEIIKLRSNWVTEITSNKSNQIVWRVDKLINLKKYLEKLINPNQAYEKNDFGIYFCVDEFKSENDKLNEYERFIGKIENTIFQKLTFKTTNIESKIIDGGKHILTSLKDKGKIIFWIKEKNEFFPYLKDITINIYYLSPYSKAFFTKQTGIRSVDYGSIYLFINGFRVPPYGEVGNDWLKLDQRKAQGYARFFGSRDVVGTIEILDTENDFPIVTSREGIVTNINYELLTNRDGFTYKTLKRLEKFVVDALDWDSSFYDKNDPKFKEIENKIIRGEIDENDNNIILFKEENAIKERRIYSSINSIVGAKPDDVVELYINENLILNKINEEKTKSEKEYEQLISDFSNKKININTLNDIFQRRILENKELEKQLQDFSKYSINEKTSDAVSRLQLLIEENKKQAQTIKELSIQLIKLEKENTENESKIQRLERDKLEAEERAIKEKNKREEAEFEKMIAVFREKKEKELRENAEQAREIEKEKYKYLESTRHITAEAQDIMHTIDISSTELDASMQKILYILNNKEDHIEIQNVVNSMRFHVDRIKKLTQLLNKTDISSLKNSIKVDIPSYIREYLPNYTQSISCIKFNELYKEPYVRKVSLLDLSVILDNLVSNSKKAGAKNIFVDFKNENGKLFVDFSDDGHGVEQEILKHNALFQLGITNRPGGSGIGLATIKNILNKELYGDIEFVGNGVYFEHGATFRLIF